MRFIHSACSSNINTRDSVSSGYPNTEKRVEIRGVWIADETLSRVFDKSSKSKQKLRSQRRSKIVKIYANQDRISKLYELLMSLRIILIEQHKNASDFLFSSTGYYHAILLDFVLPW